MTKRKTLEEKAARKQAEPRKRVAVSVSKSAATKAIIARNASTSPLLGLPPEIRQKIWKKVLGNNLIHLRYLYDDDVDFTTNDSLHGSMNYSRKAGKSYGGAWRHQICEEDAEENKPEEKRTYPYSDEAYLYRPHQFCSPEYETPNPYKGPIDFGSNHETVPLTILRVCQQTYAEANRVLWTTNTFSFPDGTTFGRFMMTRNINQKRWIKKLRFAMDWCYHGYREWNKILNMPLIKSLTGIQNLRVWRYIKSTEESEGLRKLSTLPLASAEVSVRDPKYGLSKGLWTESTKQSVADGLQSLLVDSKGAEAYAEARRKISEFNKREREMLASRRRPLPRN